MPFEIADEGKADIVPSELVEGRAEAYERGDIAIEAYIAFEVIQCRAKAHTAFYNVQALVPICVCSQY